MAGTEYTVHLCVKVKHQSGPEPEWDAVADSLADTLKSWGFGAPVSMADKAEGPWGFLRVADAAVDTAEDLEEE